MKIKNLARLIVDTAGKLSPAQRPAIPTTNAYRPTPYLAHPFLQSVYNISEPLFPFKFQREPIFLEDGGHISLDWLPAA
jgi:hypothetical protein